MRTQIEKERKNRGTDRKQGSINIKISPGARQGITSQYWLKREKTSHELRKTRRAITGKANRPATTRAGKIKRKADRPG